MRKILLSSFFLLFLHVYGQEGAVTNDTITDIVAEGKLLYQSEMASWNGTDLFLEKFKQVDAIGGYVSYSEGDQHKCIFISQDEKPNVLGTVSFDASFSKANARVDLKNRALTDMEKEYLAMRIRAKESMEKDTFFITYENTSFNLIPIIFNGEKKVYVLTGPKGSGVVLFGNDYLISMDKNNQVTGKKKLHRSIIPVYTERNGMKATETMHNHKAETGDYITPTDICTLMLYSKYTSWEKHRVMSSRFMNVWDCLNHSLTVYPLDQYMNSLKEGNK